MTVRKKYAIIKLQTKSADTGGGSMKKLRIIYALLFSMALFLAIPLNAAADFGPKPSVAVRPAILRFLHAGVFSLRSGNL